MVTRSSRRPRCWLLLALLVSIGAAACAAPKRQPPRGVPSSAPEPPPQARLASPPGRPLVGVAFGGGSARGIAHVGVLRWLEEHRIPVDLAAGTSMGGLIGGAFASGMDAAETRTLVTTLDWDDLFGASTFAVKNIRRKADARAYPSRLEFGLRGGIVPPVALNTGERVEWLFARITAPYYESTDFDDLPTPFRTVAMDLLSSQTVVMRRGSLADALRATMSLPLIFPPVEVDGRVLVDGGTMNNVPADVVKAMGADRVIAVNVGELGDRDGVSYTMLGLAGTTLDAMMRASTRRALAAADIVIDVPLGTYGSLDWRRAEALIEEGYKAAEARRADLLPLAVGEAEFEAWKRGRQARRRTALPPPAFVALEGFEKVDAARLEKVLAPHVGQPLEPAAVETTLAPVAGLDRYDSVTWRLATDAAKGTGLLVTARPKASAPPFLMLGLNLENTTSSDFRTTLTARYLTYGVLGSGSELRIDGTLGSEPGAAIALHRPLGKSALFVAPYAGVQTRNFEVIDEDAILARYRQRILRAGVDAGVELGVHSDLRVGVYVGRATASIDVGDPGLPELRGKETGAILLWRMDTQDSPVVPSRGTLARVSVTRLFDAPEVAIDGSSVDVDDGLSQLAMEGNRFWSRGRSGRLFVSGGVGTSFDRDPLPTSKFAMGSPFRLGAYSAGELRGSHYYALSSGYFHRIGRLPDFVGGPIFGGAWLETGDAFDEWSLARGRANGGAGVVLDTLVGPVLLAGSWSFDGRWRTYIGVGRIVR